MTACAMCLCAVGYMHIEYFYAISKMTAIRPAFVYVCVLVSISFLYIYVFVSERVRKVLQITKYNLANFRYIRNLAYCMTSWTDE